MMEQPTASPFFKPIGMAASILGICQGVAWAIMSFLAILTYADTMTEAEGMSPSSLLTRSIYHLFTDHGVDNYMVLSGSDFLVWSILYLILSLLWLTISIYLLFAIHGQFVHHYKPSILIWSILTMVISILDISLVIALGVLRQKFDVVDGSITMWNAAGVLMTIAARGYVLWLINILLAMSLLKLLDKFVPNKPPQQRYGNPHYGLPSTTTSWAQQQDPWRNSAVDSRALGRTNSGYSWEGEGSIPRVNPNLDYSNNGNPYNNKPLRGEDRPPIPSPDYSPPNGNRSFAFGQPPLKSAMKYQAPAPPRHKYPDY